MAMREAVLVVDVGTSKVHANLIGTENGALLAAAQHAISWSHPQPGWTECEPEAVWTAVVESVRGAMAAKGECRLIAVAGSFQGDGFLLEDENGAALYPLIVAMDRRGVPYVEAFATEFGAERFQEILGCPLGAWEPMKYYWFTQNRPALLARAHHITSVQEYVLRRMGLGYHQDYTLASRKVMRDWRKNEWSQELCDFLGLSAALFDSPVSASDAICGTVRCIGDVDLGEELPVMVGAHDCEMGMFGVGVLPGSTAVLANVAGTTDHLGFLPTRPFSMDGLPLCIYRGPFDDSYVALGANAVGASISWGVNRLFPEKGSYDETIAALFSTLRFDADSRVVHLGGVEAANGSFLRVNLETTREELFKALVEGVTYPLCAVYDAMRQVSGSDFGVIRIGNGGAKSRSWVQLKTNLFNTPIETVVNNEISSVGAAALAAVRLGRHSSLETALAAMVQVRERVEPEEKIVRRYRERLAQWQALSAETL